MSDLHLEREFRVTPERLFQAVSAAPDLMQWWGPEGMHIPEGDMDFTRTGAWFSVMQDGDGQQYKVSGQVTHVDPPKSVGFTFGWHDEQDQRGAESHVMFTVVPTDAGARLILDHRGFADSEQMASHETGWTSSLRKLAEQLGQ